MMFVVVVCKAGCCKGPSSSRRAASTQNKYCENVTGDPTFLLLLLGAVLGVGGLALLELGVVGVAEGLARNTASFRFAAQKLLK